MYLRGISGLLTAGVVAMSAAPVWAAAWTLPQGKGQVITTASYYSTDRYYSASGTEFTQPAYHKRSLDSLVEYGLRDEVTVGGTLRLEGLSQRHYSTGASEHNTGIGNTDLFVRYKFWEQNGTVLAVQPMLILPRVIDNGDYPELGSAHTAVEMRGLAATSFAWGGQYHFANVELAYRHRTGAPADQWQVDATLGLRPAKDWLVLGQWFSTWRADGLGMTTPTITDEENYELAKLQLTVVYDWSEAVSLQLGGFGHVRSRNTGGGGGMLASVWYRF